MSELRLSGPPRIGTLTLPHCWGGQPVTMQWDDSASIYVRRQDGVHRVRARLVGRLSLGWRRLDYADASALRMELDAGIVQVTPRTRVSGDSESLIERSWPMRVLTPARELDALLKDGIDVAMELETVDYFEEVPPWS